MRSRDRARSLFAQKKVSNLKNSLWFLSYRISGGMAPGFICRFGRYYPVCVAGGFDATFGKACAWKNESLFFVTLFLPFDVGTLSGCICLTSGSLCSSFRCLSFRTAHNPRTHRLSPRRINSFPFQEVPLRCRWPCRPQVPASQRGASEAL